MSLPPQVFSKKKRMLARVTTTSNSGRLHNGADSAFKATPWPRSDCARPAPDRRASKPVGLIRPMPRRLPGRSSATRARYSQDSDSATASTGAPGCRARITSRAAWIASAITRGV